MSISFRLVLWLPIAIAFLANIAFYSDDAIDDVYITIRYAENLANLGEIRYSSLEFSEGFSNPLLMVITAMAIKLGVNPAIFVRVVGVLSYLGILHLYATLARAATTSADERASLMYWLPLLLGGLYLAVSPVFGFYASVGLETVLFALTLGWAFYFAVNLRQPWTEPAMSGLATLLVLSRPEGFAYIPFIYLARLIQFDSIEQALDYARRNWKFLIPPLVVLGVLVALRLVYFGNPLPNTVYAKAVPLSFAIKYGGQYILTYLGHWWPGLAFVMLCGIGVMMVIAASDKNESRIVAGLSMLPLSNLLFVLNAGDDWMANSRFLAPTELYIGILIFFSTHSVIRQWPNGKRQPFILLAGILVFATAMCLFAGNSRTNVYAKFREYFKFYEKREWPAVVDRLRHMDFMIPLTSGSVPINMYDNLVFPFMVENIPPHSRVVMADIGYAGYILQADIIDTNALVSPVMVRWLQTANKSGLDAALANIQQSELFHYLTRNPPDWVFLRTSPDTQTPQLWGEKAVYSWVNSSGNYTLVKKHWSSFENIYIYVYAHRARRLPSYSDIQENYGRLLSIVPTLSHYRFRPGYSGVHASICQGQLDRRAKLELKCP